MEAGSGGAQKSGVAGNRASIPNPASWKLGANFQKNGAEDSEENKLRDEVILDAVQEHQVEVVPLARSSLPKRRRLHGKRTVLNDGPEQPALYACQAWGGGMELKGQIDNGMRQFCWYSTLARIQEGQLQQEDVHGLTELKEAVTSLEQNLQRTAAEKRSELEEMALRSIQTVEGGDVLQIQTVSLDEVRKELHEWIPAFREEVHTILESGAMESISEERYQQLLKEHPDLERLPMLAVATMKPPRCRREVGGLWKSIQQTSCLIKSVDSHVEPLKNCLLIPHLPKNLWMSRCWQLVVAGLKNCTKLSGVDTLTVSTFL